MNAITTRIEKNIVADIKLTQAIKQAEKLKAKLDANALKMQAIEREYKALQEEIKNTLLNGFDEPNVKKASVCIPNGVWVWSCSEVVNQELDKQALKNDGLFEKYSHEKISYRLTTAQG